MNKLSRLTALLLALLMLFSSVASAEVISAIPFDQFDASAFYALKAAATANETYTEPVADEQCSGTYYDDECVLDTLRTMTLEERYNEMNARQQYFYAHYITYHSDTKLLCECDFPMIAPDGTHEDYCPWNPSYSEEPEEEIKLELKTLEFTGEDGLYAYVYGQLPVGAELKAETVNTKDVIPDAAGDAVSVKLTVETESGNVWQPESGSYTVNVKANGLPASGLAEVYLTTGEVGAYETNAYGVTQFTSGGVTLTLSSFGIVTMVEYVLEETTEDGTSVSVSGNVPDDVTLELASVSMDVIDTYIPGAKDSQMRKVALDIALVDGDGSVWNPSEAVTVTVNAKDLGEEGDLIVLYHIHDEQVECIGNAVMDANGDITFTMDGFSYIYAANASDDPTANCGDTDCIVDELANTEKYPTAEDRYTYFMGLCETDPDNVGYYYNHYLTSNGHEAADLLCECVENPYDPSTMLEPGNVNHNQSICPWHPNYGEEPEEEIKLTEQTLTFGNKDDDGLYAQVYGDLPVGATLKAETMNAADFVSDAVDNAVSVKLTVTTAGGNVWQPESGSYSARIEVPGIPTSGLAAVYLTSGEEGAYVTTEYGVTPISGGGVDLALTSFGIVTMAEYILEEATEDGTTVSVSGSIPDGVDLTLETVDAATAETYLPGISTVNLPYVALDIKLVNTDGTEWQPGEGKTLKVSISAEKIGVDGDSAAVFHNHDGATAHLGNFTVAEGLLTFPIDGFSCVMLLNTGDETDCWVDDLLAISGAEDRYAFLMEKKAADLSVYNTFLAHYKLNHYGELVICECDMEWSLSPAVYEPWSTEHTLTNCPWHPDNKPAEISKTVDGTTVTITGDLPANAEVSLSAKTLSSLETYLPHISDYAAVAVAFDIAVTVDGVEWQPAEDLSVNVTVASASLGSAGQMVYTIHTHVEGDAFANEEIGALTIDENGAVSFDLSSFSPVTFVNCDLEWNDCCMVEELASMLIYDRYAMLNQMYADGDWRASAFFMHYLRYHTSDAELLICICDLPLVEPGINSGAHYDTTCPWHPDNYVADSCTDENCWYTGYTAAGAQGDVAQYAYLMTEFYANGFTKQLLIDHVKQYHAAADASAFLLDICTCDEIHAPGSSEHTTGCPWAGQTVAIADHYAAYTTLSIPAKAFYLLGLDDTQLSDLEALMTADEQEEMAFLITDGVAFWLTTSEVKDWYADTTVTVTLDMLKRAFEVYVELDAVDSYFGWHEASRLEDAELINVYTGLAVADYVADNNGLYDREMGLLVGYLETTDGSIVGPAFDGRFAGELLEYQTNNE